MSPAFTLLAALLLAPLTALPAADTVSLKKPNIIFPVTDGQRDNTLGATGHPFVKPPNLDALMRDSVRFKNAQLLPSRLLGPVRLLMEAGQ